MTSRPKKDRLRRLHLAGCQVDDDEVATLSECVRLGRLENYAAFSTEPHEEQDGIDVCVCLNCDERHAHVEHLHVLLLPGYVLCGVRRGKLGSNLRWQLPCNVCDKDQSPVSLLW